MRERRHGGRIAGIILLLAVIAAMATPLTAHAQDPVGQGKTVRVGWYETPFNITDQYGRKSGYAYEYQRKIAAYTGWNYVYVEGTWPELLKMLERGEIDLMSDVSFTEQRSKTMLYSALPMGTESYYVFTMPGSAGITANDYTSLNGKRVGVTQGSIQKELFLDWEKKHGVTADLVNLRGSEEESMKLLRAGLLDAFITLDTYGGPGIAEPIFKVGSSDFYFSVNQQRPDLLVELDAAMSRIQDEDQHYNEQLFEKYLQNSGTSSYLSADELEWLENHGPIRVGYQDNYLAFCAADGETGELTGALKDYLASASAGIENAQLKFQPVAYPTAAAAIEALKNGEVDCMFPANLTDYDGEQLGLVMTAPLMHSEMDAVVRASEQKEFIRQDRVTVAVNEGNTNYEMFLMDHFPGWQIAYYPNTPAALEGVAAGEADCVIISNYRYSNIAKQCERLNLTTVPTGVDMSYCLASREGETKLYSVLSRVIGVVPESTVNAALTYNSTEDAKTGFFEILQDNLVTVIAVIAAIVMLIVLLLQRSIRAEKKVNEEEHLVADLNKRVFVDALTSVRNKAAIANHLEEIQERLDGGEHVEFAICVFDCDNLKMVNDEYGHDKGDEYLKVASRLICHVFQHSPVFRTGGDEFAAILLNEDFQNRDGLAKMFAESQESICASAENPWEEAHVSLGIAVYDARVDRSVSDTVRRADKVMYENKRVGKRGHDDGPAADEPIKPVADEPTEPVTDESAAHAADEIPMPATDESAAHAADEPAASTMPAADEPVESAADGSYSRANPADGDVV